MDNVKIFVIGASTGGPQVVEDIVSSLPVDFGVYVVVVQHMPAVFTKTFSARLDRLCDIEVREAQDSLQLEKQIVYITRGDSHLEIVKQDGHYITHLIDATKEKGIKPSIDITMRSAVEAFGGRHVVGIILSGMGQDGLEGMKMIHEQNGKTIVQDPKTSILDSMPQSVIDADVADKILMPEHIVSEMIALTKK